MFRVAFNVKKGTIERLRKKPEEMRAALIPAMKKCMAVAEATAKTKYLSGPRPRRLDRVTGRLRGSIATGVDTSGAEIKGIIGTNVVYARIHELGFKGTVSVRSHTRRVTSRNIKEAASGAAFVRAHQRRMNIRSRPFLRPALEDNMGRFKRIFSDALVKAFG